ncbi:MAG: hypothetical protein EA398_17795 [Deltaproteobacteria bacterium]|nr:MAG: hypothetical protein EA398_17795 [Deltaproteobacteria bacterium]
MTIPGIRIPMFLVVAALALSGCGDAADEGAPGPAPLDGEFQGGAFGGPPQPLPGATASDDGFAQRAQGQCPEGEIPWRFAAGGADPLGEVFQEMAGEDLTLPATPPDPIVIRSVACGGPGESVDDEQLRASCAGRSYCAYTPVCEGEFVVQYQCGAGGWGWRPELRTARPEGPNGRVELICGFEPEPPAVEERTVCVPKLCRGKARRNASLQCVPDLTMPVLDLRSERVARSHMLSITSQDEPISRATNLPSRAGDMWTLQNTLRLSDLYRREAAVERIFENGVYDIRLTLSLQERTPALERRGVRTVLWFTDVWQIGDRRVETFRCVAQTLGTGHVTAGVYEARAIDAQVNAECFAPETLAASRLEAFRRVYGPTRGVELSTAGQVQATLSHSEAHVSTDLEGRTLVINDGVDEATACAPNPPSFFYDAATNRFDALAFYGQRRWGTVDIPGSSQPRRFAFTHAPQITLGIQDVRLRDNLVTVYQFSTMPSRFSVDVDWYTAFQSSRSPHSTAQFLRNHEGVDPSPISPDDVRLEFYLHEYLTSEPIARENLTFGGMPLIHAQRVGDAGPTGTTVSVDIDIPDHIRQRFFDPNRRLHIGNGFYDQRFALLVCVATGSARNVSLRPAILPPFNPTWQNIFFGEDRYARPDLDTRMTLLLGQRYRQPRNPWSALPGGLAPAYLHERLRMGTLSGLYPNGTPRGCQWADASLHIVPDRYQRPVEPVVDRAWRGQAQSNNAGDVQMEGATGGNMGQTCEDDENGRERCQNRLGSGGRNAGQTFAGPMHDLDILANLVEGVALRVGGLTEVFGFQAVDNAGIEIDFSEITDENDQPIPNPDAGITYSLDYDDGSLTLTLFPPFEAAADALNQGRPPRSPIQWEGDDEEGLALTYTYQTPVAVGPVPGTVTVTASVGIEASVSFLYRWRRPTGAAYPCAGTTEPCFGVHSGDHSRTFAQAAAFCAERGGILAAPLSRDEATVLADRRRASNASQMWVGGQVGVRYVDPSCAARPNSPCGSPVFTTWRWLLGDALYRNEAGAFEDTIHAPGGNQPTQSAFPQALALNAASALENVHVDRRLPFACRYEPVASSHYREMGAELSVGAFAGIGVGFCTPSSKLGICLQGNLNIFNLTFTPSFHKADWTLIGNPGSESRRQSVTEIDVSLDLTLLQAELKAIARAWIFSKSWTILRYPGLKVFSASLFNYTVTSNEVLP